jgi:hypothetical protein
MEINKEYFLSHTPQFISPHSDISSQILTATIHKKKLTKEGKLQW